MYNRLLRVGMFALPFAAMSFGLMVACGDDDETPIEFGDAAADARGRDATQDQDGNADVDSGDEDAGSDANTLPDTNPPPLCVTYQNIKLVDAGSDFDYRWMRIAEHAMVSPEDGVNAFNSCELGMFYFSEGMYNLPYPFACLGRELQALTGCVIPGSGPFRYEGANDTEGTPCNTDGGETVHLGFQNPESNEYTGADVDFMAELIRLAAIDAGGLTAADAQRLKDLYLSQKAKVAAGREDAGLSSDMCELK